MPTHIFMYTYVYMCIHTCVGLYISLSIYIHMQTESRYISIYIGRPGGRRRWIGRCGCICVRRCPIEIPTSVLACLCRFWVLGTSVSPLGGPRHLGRPEPSGYMNDCMA